MRFLVVTSVLLTAALWGCKDDGANAGVDPELNLDRPVEITDIEVGEGEAVDEGYIVNITYVGTFPESDIPFDRNDRTDEDGNPVNPPLALKIGAGDVIVGMDEGLKGMKLGGVREMVVPWQKAYGLQGRPEGGIKPKQDLKFRVELLGLVKPGEEGVYDYEEIKVGTGREVREGDTVTVHFRCTYLNGMMFDDSRLRGDKEKGGQPETFKIGAVKVIRGVDDGIRGMKVGGVRKLWIPPDLAFGPSGYGGFAPNTITYVEIELLSVS